ncbi:hypothetical protein [Actinomyces ruminis]|nr:hypothetical protein [Actinomyces ruminis]
MSKPSFFDKPIYVVLEDGMVDVPCACCGDHQSVPVDRLVQVVTRGRVCCDSCLVANHEGRLHLHVDAANGLVWFEVEPSSGVVFVKKDTAVVEQAEDGVDLGSVALVDPQLDLLLKPSGGRRDLGGEVAVVDEGDVGVPPAVGDVSDPLSDNAVVVEEPLTFTAGTHDDGQVAGGFDAEPHGNVVNQNLDVAEDSGVHVVSSSVGSAVGSRADGVSGAEPTEEAPAPGREKKATSSVSGDGDEATEEVHPAAGRPDSCRPCGAGCGAGLASRSCAGPAHPTPTTGEDAVVVLDAAPFTVRLVRDDGDVFANVEADNDAMTDPRELARILRGLADRLDG